MPGIDRVTFNWIEEYYWDWYEVAFFKFLINRPGEKLVKLSGEVGQGVLQ